LPEGDLNKNGSFAAAGFYFQIHGDANPGHDRETMGKHQVIIQ